jgi:hypothetical protein
MSLVCPFEHRHHIAPQVTSQAMARADPLASTIVEVAHAGGHVGRSRRAAKALFVVVLASLLATVMFVFNNPALLPVEETSTSADHTPDIMAMSKAHFAHEDPAHKMSTGQVMDALKGQLGSLPSVQAITGSSPASKKANAAVLAALSKIKAMDSVAVADASGAISLANSEDSASDWKKMWDETK